MTRAAWLAWTMLASSSACAATGDPLPATSTAHLVFDQQFDNGIDRLSDTFYQGVGPWPGQPQTQLHIGTGELQVATNGNFLGMGIQPFSQRRGYLAALNGPLTDAQKSVWLAAVDRAGAKDAAKPAPTLTKYIPNMRLVSQYGWALTTRRSFKPPFYAEYRAKLPVAAGQWPAFYLYDYKMAPYWPVEIDAMEAPEKPGGQCYYATVHQRGFPGGKAGQRVCGDAVLAGNWHRYGILVQGHWLIWYFDGREVFRQATPGYSRYNFNLIITNAVGGMWPKLVNNNFVPGTTAETGLGSIKVWTP